MNFYDIKQVLLVLVILAGLLDLAELGAILASHL